MFVCYSFIVCLRHTYDLESDMYSNVSEQFTWNIKLGSFWFGGAADLDSLLYDHQKLIFLRTNHFPSPLYVIVFLLGKYFVCDNKNRFLILCLFFDIFQRVCRTRFDCNKLFLSNLGILALQHFSVIAFQHFSVIML